MRRTRHHSQTRPDKKQRYRPTLCTSSTSVSCNKHLHYHNKYQVVYLKVSDDRESQGSTPSGEERETVDGREPGLYLVGAAVLQDLLVSDVESHGEQQGPQVDQLAEDAALRRSGGGVTDVRPVQGGVVQAHTTVGRISVIAVSSRTGQDKTRPDDETEDKCEGKEN